MILRIQTLIYKFHDMVAFKNNLTKVQNSSYIKSKLALANFHYQIPKAKVKEQIMLGRAQL